MILRNPLKENLKKMYSIDINKVKALQDIHWKWFWKRAAKSSIEFKHANGGCLKINYQIFLKLFFGWNEEIVMNILLATKEEMFDLINENGSFYKAYKNSLKQMIEVNSSVLLSSEEMFWEVEKFVRDLFGYKDFENGSCPLEDGRSLWRKDKNWKSKRRFWNAYAFTSQMGIDVCPYCGRQYTFTLGDGDGVKNGRPQIDHYIPEAEYPFLSCSLFNFIPSCASCNHQKSDKYNSKKVEWRNIPYPYEDFDAISKRDGKKLYDDMKFKAFYQFLRNDDGKITDKLCYGVKLRENGATLTGELKNADEAFHLEDLYNMHDLELEDLFTRYRIYNKSRLKNILTVIYSAQNTSITRQFKNMISSESCRLKNVILGFPLGNSDRQYPLKKFKEDIVKQLDDTCKKMKKGQ